MDFIRRPEYMSANIAEHAMGKSPYKHVHEAAWAGLSGERRVDYIDLTGNPWLGIALGFALDPLTYVPFGAIPKIAKATKIPGAIGRVAAAAGKKWPLLNKAGVTARWMFTDANARLKFISGWDEAHDLLRAAGISDDILKNVKNTGVIDDALRGAVKGKGPQALNALDKLAETSRTMFESMKMPARMNAMKSSMLDEYADMTRWFSTLEKKHPDIALSLIHI